jgi:hypothetical protein
VADGRLVGDRELTGTVDAIGRERPDVAPLGSVPMGLRDLTV